MILGEDLDFSFEEENDLENSVYGSDSDQVSEGEPEIERIVMVNDSSEDDLNVDVQEKRLQEFEKLKNRPGRQKVH